MGVITIAIVCNLSDGVVLGADSAITVTTTIEQGSGVTKVFNKADKVFALSKLSLGIVSYGVAMMENRSIGSYIEEFEATVIEKNQKSRDSFSEMKINEIAGELNNFFYGKYKPCIEDNIKSNVRQKSANQEIHMPTLGLVVAGYSPGEYLAEVVDVSIPAVIPPQKPNVIRGKGNFGTNWFGNVTPLTALIKQINPKLIDALVGYFVENHKVKFTARDKKDIGAIISRFEQKIPYAAMPIDEGVEHVGFLLNTVIGMTKWVVGAPTCGGPTKIGIVKRKEELKLLYHN